MDGQDISVNDALRNQLAQFTAAPEAQQAPAQEPAAQAPAPAPEPSQQAAPAAQDPRMAKVIAQAQQVRAEREAFKREQAQFEADRQELAHLRELKARAKEDPVGWAEAGGYKPDEYAGVLMDKGAVTPEKRKIWEQEQKIGKLESRLNSWEQEKQQNTEQQYYNHVINEMKQVVASAGENYDLVQRMGAYPLVFQRIQQHFTETQAMGDAEVMPYEQALEIVEQELFDKYATPLLESPKIKSRYGVSPAVPPPQSAPQQAPAARPSGTITPNMRGMSSPPRQMSEEESLEAAGRLLFKGFPGGR